MIRFDINKALSLIKDEVKSFLYLNSLRKLYDIDELFIKDNNIYVKPIMPIRNIEIRITIKNSKDFE